MDKFFAYDNLLYELYGAEDLQSAQEYFFYYIKKMIPHDYGSILMLSEPSGQKRDVQITDYFCEPGEFSEAERNYIEKYPQEMRQRLALTGESSVVRLSSVEPEEERLDTPVYRDCYQSYDIYDILQLAVRHEGDLLAVISLFRTRESGAFADADVYLLKSLKKHLNRIFCRFCRRQNSVASVSGLVAGITSRVHMTPKETEILSLIFQAKSNDEICEALGIKEHTLQKHFQNIYRKLNISSRWELLRVAVNGGKYGTSK